MSIPADPAPSAPPPVAAPASERDVAERLLAGRGRIEAELAKAIVGQREVIGRASCRERVSLNV